MRASTILLTSLLALGALPEQARAHPYLAEDVLAIDDARSLPWNGETNFGLVADYDVRSRLVADTLALLTPTTLPLVRFETLRRAVLYLSPRFSTPQVAVPIRAQLARRLQGRVDRDGVTRRLKALSRFDLGCFEWLCSKDRTLASGRGGTMEVLEAAAGLPEAGAEIAFLLHRMGAVATTDDSFFDQALAGATEGTRLARNLLQYFQYEFSTLAELRADLEATRKADPPGPGFPQPPPVPGADPSVRHSVVVLVPAALSVRDAGDALEVGWVEAHPQPVQLEVGHRMVVGTRINESVWVGGKRVAAHDSESLLGGEPMHAVQCKGYLRDLPEPADGAPVVLRATVQIFETDIPTQHLWAPACGRYRVMWERTYETRLR